MKWVLVFSSVAIYETIAAGVGVKAIVFIS